MKAPLIDRVIGGWTGDALAWLAKRAHRRGDAHEFAHLYAMLEFGNSNHAADRWPCSLAYAAAYLKARDGEHRRFSVSLTSEEQLNAYADDPSPHPEDCRGCRSWEAPIHLYRPEMPS